MGIRERFGPGVSERAQEFNLEVGDACGIDRHHRRRQILIEAVQEVSDYIENERQLPPTMLDLLYARPAPSINQCEFRSKSIADMRPLCHCPHRHNSFCPATAPGIFL
jgi:hypothetical protein